MLGPYLLRYVELFVKERSAGAYILSRNGRSADRVGASAHDIGHAVREAGKDQPYRYFWFAYAATAQQAFDLERTWHHRFRPTDNPQPPRTNTGEHWRCTIAGCATCALTPLAAR